MLIVAAIHVGTCSTMASLITISKPLTRLNKLFRAIQSVQTPSDRFRAFRQQTVRATFVVQKLAHGSASKMGGFLFRPQTADHQILLLLIHFHYSNVY